LGFSVGTSLFHAARQRKRAKTAHAAQSPY
jgi:hypothetical protein